MKYVNMKYVKWMALAAALLLAAYAGYRSGQHSAPAAATSAVAPERKVLYYRNPMGLPDTSPVPKKDAMGMDYVPVYAGDVAADEGAVSISPDRVQKLGVKSEAVARRQLEQTLRATGVVAVDERRIHAVAPKFEGWIERLQVSASGQPVARGQALFDVYSPELVSAQREYQLAAQGVAALGNADAGARTGMQQLAEASLARLNNWDIPAAELARLKSGREAGRTLSFYSPVSGVVLEKRAVQGMRFMPGETLFQIADLSSVWVLAEVPEQQIGQVQPGGIAEVSISAYSDRQFKGRVAFVYPTLNAATRTVQARIELANPGGRLKPGMYASVTLPTGGGGAVLAVPESAVIDSGARQVVLVQQAEGRFLPRNVRLGRRGGDYVEVLEGLAEGERVVTSALFLIDAESNLKAALGGMSSAKPVSDAGRASAGQGDVGLKPDLPSRIVGHQARGVLDAINADGTVSITHQPVKSLGWPGMSMDFELANASLAQGIAAGSAVTFELVERAPDEWVITKLQAVKAAGHEGH